MCERQGSVYSDCQVHDAGDVGLAVGHVEGSHCVPEVLANPVRGLGTLDVKGRGLTVQLCMASQR